MEHQEQVTREYKEHVASIRAMLKRLSDKASGNHFAADPETADWAALGDIRRIEIQLKTLSDLVFHEGEYAG